MRESELLNRRKSQDLIENAYGVLNELARLYALEANKLDLAGEEEPSEVGHYEGSCQAFLSAMKVVSYHFDMDDYTVELAAKHALENV